jgi:hypothetical protein
MFLNAYLSGFPLDINSGFQYATGDTHLPFYQAAYIRPANDLTATEQVLIRPAALLNALNMSSSKHVCLKTHYAKVNVDGIPAIPATISAGAVYVIRDPRDIAISYADHSGVSIDEMVGSMNNIKHANEHESTGLIHVLTTWSIHVQTWTVKNNDVPVTVVRYEDMLEKPEETFTKALCGLGLSKDIDRDKFNFALKETQFSNLRKLEDSGGFREKGQGDKFFRVGKSGQWKSKLAKHQVKRIEEDHGEVMAQYGYL